MKRSVNLSWHDAVLIGSALDCVIDEVAAHSCVDGRTLLRDLRRVRSRFPTVAADTLVRH